jgi:hypothetical protein
VLHLEKVVGGSLNVLADVMTVSWPVKQGTQDQHVKSALQQVGFLRCRLCHGRRSTPDED